MAAVTANVVLCRAPVADVRARSANAAASRAPVSPMPHPQVTRMSMLQGSASKTLGVRQHAGRAAARDTALRAITDAKAEAAEAEANPEPALESDVSAVREPHPRLPTNSRAHPRKGDIIREQINTYVSTAARRRLGLRRGSARAGCG